jgi:selenocysteine lyase/cysteine desulfurase
MAQNHQYRELIYGADILVPSLQGEAVPYINFDNAASTPPFRSVLNGVNRFMEYYSSVHRGNGYKSQYSTWAYEQARKRVIQFVGGDPAVHTCIFGKNTTEAINKVARRFCADSDDIVLTTGMEHHSNDLPFRLNGRLIHVGLQPDGRLDEGDLERKLEEYHGRIRLLTITGASNVTGYLNPIHRIAERVHQAGGQILVDCAQIAPHRRVEMGSPGRSDSLDFVALSAHKMYAPYGCGALIGPTQSFAKGTPDLTGGGTVEIVTLDHVVWAEPPDRDEAGSPNVVGAIALDLSIQQLDQIGMEEVTQHEQELTKMALEGMRQIPGVKVFGDPDPKRADQRLGVIPFQMVGTPHFLVAAILGHEFGIGVRSGCFCAHPYVLHLLNLTDEESEEHQRRIVSGDRSQMPGLVRASFGIYNTPQEVERFLSALSRIAAGQYEGTYHQDMKTGEFKPEGWDPQFEQLQ